MKFVSMGIGGCSLFTKTRSGLLAVIVLFSQLSYVSSLTASEKEGIQRGLEAGRVVANLLASFKGTVSTIGTSIGPFLAVIGPFVDITLAFIPTETAELAELKRMMERIDNRFDQMDSHFNDIKRMIDWSSVEVNFGQIEQKILAMSFEYEQLYKVPRNATANQKILFLNSYDGDYQNSGTKLYNGLTKQGGTFESNLGTLVMHYTKNDRKQTRKFLLGIMQLLIQAARIEIVYLQTKNFTEIARHKKTLWETRINTLVPIYKRIDQTVKNKFASQYRSDTREYAADHTRLSHNDFARGLYYRLKNKYYWRHWIVFAYNQISGWDLHTLSVRSGSGVCAGDTFLRQNGRNIWVQSCEENVAKLDVGRAERYLRNIDQDEARYCHPRGCAVSARSARDVFNSLDFNEYNPCAAAAISKDYTDLAYYGNTERLALYNVKEYFHLIMWG